MASPKRSLLSLPIAPADRLHCRTVPADPLFPSFEAISTLSSRTPGEKGFSPPSFLRRSRQMRNGGLFCYTTPLPLPFPYEVPKDEAVDGEIDVETWLASLEPSLAHPVGPGSVGYSSPKRDAVLAPKGEGAPRLLSLSATCLRDVLPMLDAGTDEPGDAAREELVGVLSGRIAVFDETSGFAPYASGYHGYQFGSNAGQLGDGRAIVVFATPAPAQGRSPPIAELQLKGAGRTPFSRFADGLAVLRSSVREYLGSEANAALGIPTSRALSLIHLPSVHVARERMETAAVVCRVAPSWVRVGSFQMPRERHAWSSLVQLVRYTATKLFELAPRTGTDGPGWAERVLRECAERNAKTFAAWQVQGWMHGVLNTDNISILGLTIDYGPYAFMDGALAMQRRWLMRAQVYDENHICNHSDDFGLYSYRQQPSRAVFAIDKLGDSLAEMIGAERESAGELGDDFATGHEAKLAGWREVGREVVEEVKREMTLTLTTEYRRLMAERFAIDDPTATDAPIWHSFLDLLERHRLDFHSSFRLLAQFVTTTDPSFERLLDRLLPPVATGTPARPEDARRAWTSWFEMYEGRLAASAQSVAERQARLRRANPRFVLRQWILEETIQRLEAKNDTAFLERVLRMATAPFEPYAERGLDDDGALCLTGEAAEDERLCGLGPRDLQGFQCSCSS